MLPTIDSSRSNRPPSHPHPPPRRKPSASEVLSLVAAKYAELFHYLHTVPPPAASPSTPSDSSSPPSATLPPPTADISNAIFQDHDDDHRDNKINGSSQTSLPAAQQTQALLTPHELAAIHHAAAWSLAQQPHLLLEAREQRPSENSSGQQVKRQSHPEPNDERVANGDLGAGKGGGGADDGERELSTLLRRELGVLDNFPVPSISVPIASTAATPPQNPPPPCDPDHHATIDPAGPGSSNHKSDDEAGKNDSVANPEGEEEAEDAAKTAKEDHDQLDYNQAFTAVLERTHIDYLALKGLVRMYLCAWQARKDEGGGSSNGEETTEEKEGAEEERQKRWRSAAEKKAAIELACRRYAQTFEGELRERRERSASSLMTGMDQRSSGLPLHHQQRPSGNPLLQHLQKQRLPLGASQQVPQHQRRERRGEEVVDGWAEQWVRPVVRWREEGKRVLPAGREDEGEDTMDWKSILAHGSEKVKSVTREENQDVRVVGHRSLKRAASNACKEEVVEGASRSFDGNGVGHGDVTSVPRGAKRKRQISLHALNELGSAEFNSSTGVRATTPFPTPLPPQTPWTASEHETRHRMWSQCLDRMNGAESRPRGHPSETHTISNNHHPSLHLPSDLTQHQVRTWYNRWQELRNSPNRGNEHDERELQRLSALLAEARPLIAQWKGEDATVREQDRKRRRVDGWGVPTNAWTMGTEQDTIGFGSPIQHSQSSRLLCEPLFSPAGEGDSTTPSWSALSSAFGRAPVQQQYQHHHQQQHKYPHQHQSSPQQHPGQSFSHSFAIPTTRYHKAQRQPEPQQHKRIDSYETLANDSFSHHANHFPTTPAHQQIRQSPLHPPPYSSLSTPSSDAAQSWDIRPLSTTTNPSDFSVLEWTGEGSAQGGPFGNHDGNTASGTNLHGGQRNGTSFPLPPSFPSTAATTTSTPTRTPNHFPGTSSASPTAGLNDDQASEPSHAAGRRQNNASFSAAVGDDAFDPLDFSRDSGWDDARFSAAFGQETWMEDWAEAAGNDGGGIV